MGSCLKCGRAKLKRDKLGRRKCKRCGFMPSGKFLDLGGNPTDKTWDVLPESPIPYCSAENARHVR